MNVGEADLEGYGLPLLFYMNEGSNQNCQFYSTLEVTLYIDGEF